MPTRLRTQYVCQQCGRTAARELGRCPQCGAWNSMVGEAVAPPKPRRVGTSTSGGRRAPQRLAEIEGEAEARLALPIEEFARVLGGGIVPASVVLVGGEPGIGKSTLLLQTAVQMAHHGPVLYVSGEESERQIKARAQRLFGAQGVPDGLFLYSETDLESIIHHLEGLQPILAVIDSIQTVYLPELDSSAGSITQVRDCASRLQAVAKAGGTAIFLVGHVTKEGAIAGPRVLEHIVDTVLYLEGDPFHAYRLLRSVKNRFGATTEVGVFEMGAGGMAEVPNPSEAFLAERVVNAPGSAIAVTMEGTRPLLVEVQGLTSPTSFGHPRRTANGVDLNRLLLTIAVLTRRVGLKLAEQDVFVNVVGGLRVEEPAADLAIAASLASSVWDRALPADTVLIGEVGLSGELRAVGQLPARLREAARLGFRRAIVPGSIRLERGGAENLAVVEARSVREALRLAAPESRSSNGE
ncbi:MAG: DNA repair protein RadA [Chloroflexi bacterium]|nr:DNA repair protein RadA [Chloroflexota bacterium]